MTPKQQQPATNTGETLDDSTAVITGHEISTILNRELVAYVRDEPNASVAKELAKRGKQIGLEFDDNAYNQLAETLQLLIALRAWPQLSDQQNKEARSFRDHSDPLGLIAWIGQNIPNLQDLAHEELEKLFKYFDEPSLTQLGIHAQNKKIVKVSAERIIEQAEAAGFQPPEPITHPAPDTQIELQATALEANHLANVVAKLRQRDMPLSPAEAEATIAGLHEISERTARVARELGLHAIELRLMSQLKLSKLLGVSNVTIGRWYHEATEHPEESKD